MNKDTFCILPFKHLYADPDGKIRACCIAESFSGKENNIRLNSISEAYNSPEFKSLRKDLISGVKNPVCKVCWEREDTGGKSQRLYSNKRFGFDFKSKNDGAVNPNFSSIDIRFSNLCNFKCIMCGPWLSSAHWGENEKKQGIPKVVKIKDNIVSELIPFLGDLEYVFFGGGEPLIMPEHYQMLSFLEEYKTSITIKYTTNLSIIKHDIVDLINIWKKFNKVQIQVSIDGLFEKGEKIRVGLDTKKFLENIRVLQESNIYYTLSYTTGNHNIFDIYDFIDNVFKYNIAEDESIIELHNYVTSPEKFSLHNMSQLQKQQAIDYLNSGIVNIKTEYLKSQIINLINFLKEL
jgi:MoaA/NifB/PqqE/SkfB family radical SAM enzyme